MAIEKLLASGVLGTDGVEKVKREGSCDMEGAGGSRSIVIQGCFSTSVIEMRD